MLSSSIFRLNLIYDFLFYYIDKCGLVQEYTSISASPLTLRKREFRSSERMKTLGAEAPPQTPLGVPCSSRCWMEGKPKPLRISPKEPFLVYKTLKHIYETIVQGEKRTKWIGFNTNFI